MFRGRGGGWLRELKGHENRVYILSITGDTGVAYIGRWGGGAESQQVETST